MHTISLAAQRSRALEFGIYRDGDNNLDASQQNVLTQAREVSLADRSIQFTVENTGALRQAQGDTWGTQGDAVSTETYTLDGGVKKSVDERPGVDMSSPDTLANFVARTLDNAEASGAKQTWIDLVDHGAGDGGGLEADTYGGVMPMPSIAAAIAKGVKMHAQEHPEDAGRGVDGVVANQCLMASMGFADALSSAGVKYLAASPETMVSPGTPTTVAEAIASHLDDPRAMGKAVVSDVMRTKYAIRTPEGADVYGPAAAFDVLDLGTKKIDAAEAAIKTFNDDAALAATSAGVRAALRDDVRSVDGMVRFPEATPDMPWNADRPAEAVYRAIADDARLSTALREEAHAAETAVGNLVLAHGESTGFAPFGGSNYTDAAGPTIHAPVNRNQIDPWAPSISETANAFYRNVDQDRFVGAIA